ncbi:MAG: hypothetical protein K0R14_1267 [Burkholderiales bacterium]|jgi:ubiquinone/menaquinone biosynthesis C-methylase UbiE|nr:hypothetical protein [Burkholderiales bacterium]
MWVFVIYLLLAIIVVSLIWRFTSTRYPIPCPAWMGKMIAMENPLAKAHRAIAIVKNSGISTGMRVIDAGCGPGRVTVEIAKAVGANGKVLAFDIQQKMLDQAKEHIDKNRYTNVEYYCCNFHDLALTTNDIGGAVDVITLTAVLGETTDKVSILNRLLSLLKPSGIIIITEIMADPHYITIAASRKLAEDTNLQEVKIVKGLIDYSIILRK